MEINKKGLIFESKGIPKKARNLLVVNLSLKE